MTDPRLAELKRVATRERELLARRNVLITELRREGMALRAVGRWAGMSHQQIKNISQGRTPKPGQAA